VNNANKLTINTTYNVTVLAVTCFGYINSHEQSVQKKRKNFDMYPQKFVSNLKTYNEFICKISI